MGTAVVLYTRTGGVGVRNDGRGIRASGRAVADVYATANAINTRPSSVTKNAYESVPSSEVTVVIVVVRRETGGRRSLFPV